jgi:hypothetical protein
LTTATKKPKRSNSEKQLVSKQHLIQLSGSFSQSVLQRYRSHDSQPIGGVLTKPLSSVCALNTAVSKTPSRNISASGDICQETFSNTAQVILLSRDAEVVYKNGIQKLPVVL